MLPIRNCGPLILSLTIGLSTGLRPASADEPVVQKFGDWKVTIQPGVRAVTAAIPTTPARSATIRLASQTETLPVDQEVVPPAPAQPENIEIIPDTAQPTGHTAAPADAAPCRTVDPLALVQIYSQIYQSIPFSRAEYEANPSYRHDATMEFLFGQMRPTVIQRGTTVVNHRYPNAYLPAPAYSPYGFNSYYSPFSTGFVRPYSLW